jgi:hypothetical protein
MAEYTCPTCGFTVVSARAPKNHQCSGRHRTLVVVVTKVRVIPRVVVPASSQRGDFNDLHLPPRLRPGNSRELVDRHGRRIRGRG